MPPAARTGICKASTTAGTSTIVATYPVAAALGALGDDEVGLRRLRLLGSETEPTRQKTAIPP